MHESHFPQRNINISISLVPGFYLAKNCQAFVQFTSERFFATTTTVSTITLN